MGRNSTSSKSDLVDVLLRNDLASFVPKTFSTVTGGQRFLPNWHVRAITHQLQRVSAGETKRLLITMPPRSLKSICASVAFPAFLLGKNPTRRIVCVSYAEDLCCQARTRLSRGHEVRMVSAGISRHPNQPNEKRRPGLRDHPGEAGGCRPRLEAP